MTIDEILSEVGAVAKQFDDADLFDMPAGWYLRLADIIKAADDMANEVVCAEGRAQAVRAVGEYRKVRNSK